MEGFDADLESFWAEEANLGRTLYFNSTYAGYYIAAGAGLVIMAAIGLYLYDYYFTAATAKVDTAQYYNPNNDPNYYYQQQARYNIQFSVSNLPFFSRNFAAHTSSFSIRFRFSCTNFWV